MAVLRFRLRASEKRKVATAPACLGLALVVRVSSASSLDGGGGVNVKEGATETHALHFAS